MSMSYTSNPNDDAQIFTTITEDEQIYSSYDDSSEEEEVLKEQTLVQRAEELQLQVALSAQEQQRLEANCKQQDELAQVRERLAMDLIALAGRYCVRKFLPSAQAPEVQSNLGIICFENLEPKYICRIARYLTRVQSDYQQHQLAFRNDVRWDCLAITITHKSLQGLNSSADSARLVLNASDSWVVPDEQNAAHWRNNNPAQTLNLCAVFSGEAEDTLGNFRDRMIDTNALKLCLANKDTLQQILMQLPFDMQQAIEQEADLRKWPQIGLLNNAIKFLRSDEQSLASLSLVLSNLHEVLGLSPLALSEYLAEVLICCATYQYGYDINAAMGLAMYALHYPADHTLFTTGKGGRKLTDNKCNKIIKDMCKTRPSSIAANVNGSKSLNDLSFKAMYANLQELYPNGSASGADVAATTDDDAQASSILTAEEAALCKNFLLAMRKNNQLLLQSDTQLSQRELEQSFAYLCQIEWVAKLERFLGTQTTNRSKKRPLNERTNELFQNEGSSDEQLTAEEEEIVELAKKKSTDLSAEERNQLGDFYNSHRSIFAKDHAISKEWEKLIYEQTQFNSSDFIVSFSEALLALYANNNAEEAQLSKVELKLDFTLNELLERNFNVLAYFSVRYGSLLKHLQEALGDRLEIMLNGPLPAGAPNPVLNFPAFWEWYTLNGVREVKCSKETKNALTLKFRLTPYYVPKRNADKLKPGTALQFTWQLPVNSPRFYFYNDLQSILRVHVLSQGLFGHNIFTAKGAIQALDLMELNTFTQSDGGKFVSFFANDQGSISSQYRQTLAKMRKLYPELHYLQDALKQSIDQELRDFSLCFDDFEGLYFQALEHLNECALSVAEIESLSHSYTRLQFTLENSTIVRKQNNLDLRPLRDLASKLIALVMKVGMAYTTEAPNTDLYVYAIATPFHVESLRSFACKIERMKGVLQEILLAIFDRREVLPNTDRKVFLEALRQDLAFYDAPEVCLSANQDKVLMATQSLGGYTLYESQEKINLDLGFTSTEQGPSHNLKLAQAKSKGQFYGSDMVCSGVGGIGKASSISTTYIDGIIDQVKAYIHYRPDPMSQCTLVISHCNLPSFVSELCSRLKCDICDDDALAPYLPQKRLNVVILCQGIKQAQEFNHIFALDQLANPDLGNTDFVKSLSISIILEQQLDNMRNGTLNEYLERNSIQLSQNGDFSNTTLKRFGHIGLMVHAFDSQAKFQFVDKPYPVQVVQDVIGYQPMLMNDTKQTESGVNSRFVVCPTLPLSKIQYLHSLYFLYGKNNLSFFNSACTALAQALEAEAQALDGKAEGAGACNWPQTIATPLYEHIMSGNNSQDLRQIVDRIHEQCDVVFYLDDLMSRQQLQHIKPDIEVIYYQKLSNAALNFIVASTSSNALAMRYLSDLVGNFGITSPIAERCVQSLCHDAVQLSGHMLLRAQRKKLYTSELMGVVLSYYLAQGMMQWLTRKYSGAQLNTYKHFLFLDDYKALFFTDPRSEKKLIADLLGMQVIRYADPQSHGTNNQYLLNLMVVESKFLGVENTGLSRKSLNQAKNTTDFLYRIFNSGNQTLAVDCKQWLNHIADFLQEKNDNSDDFSVIMQLIRAGQVDVLINGCSFVFAQQTSSHSTDLWSLEAIVSPEYGKVNPEFDCQVLQLQLGHGAIMQVLEDYSQNSRSTYNSLAQLQEQSEDAYNTLIAYLDHDDQRIILSPQDSQFKAAHTARSSADSLGVAQDYSHKTTTPVEPVKVKPVNVAQTVTATTNHASKVVTAPAPVSNAANVTATVTDLTMATNGSVFTTKADAKATQVAPASIDTSGAAVSGVRQSRSSYTLPSGVHVLERSHSRISNAETQPQGVVTAQKHSAQPTQAIVSAQTVAPKTVVQRDSFAQNTISKQGSVQNTAFGEQQTLSSVSSTTLSGAGSLGAGGATRFSSATQNANLGKTAPGVRVITRNPAPSAQNAQPLVRDSAPQPVGASSWNQAQTAAKQAQVLSARGNNGNASFAGIADSRGQKIPSQLQSQQSLSQQSAAKPSTTGKGHQPNTAMSARVVRGTNLDGFLRALMPHTYAVLSETQDTNEENQQRIDWCNNQIMRLNLFFSQCGIRPKLLDQTLTPNGAVLFYDGATLDFNELEQSKTLNSIKTRMGVSISAVIPLEGKIEVHIASPERMVVTYPELMRERELFITPFTDQLGRPHPGFNKKFVLGRREGNNKPVYFDLQKDEQHLLIGGTTGSGKSVLLKTLLTDMALTNSPKELRLILADPKKGSEMRVFGKLPHVMGLSDLLEQDPQTALRMSFSSSCSNPSVSTSKVLMEKQDCVTALRVLVNMIDLRNKEIDQLNQLLEQQGSDDAVTKIDDYNAQIIKFGKARMPHVFFVFDEFAFWAQDKDFAVGLSCINKIAATGRSVGIHLILLTQRPDRKLIDGTLHNNFGSRICLKMSSINDSKVMLEDKHYNASSLQGKGHMICNLNSVGGNNYCYAQAGYINTTGDCSLGSLITAIANDWNSLLNKKK